VCGAVRGAVPDVSKDHTAFVFIIEVLDCLAVTVLCDVVSGHSVYPAVCLSVCSQYPVPHVSVCNGRFVLPVTSSDPQFVLILILHYAYEIEVHGVSVRSYGTELHGRECAV
jgi:hypothetical protein